MSGDYIEAALDRAWRHITGVTSSGAAGGEVMDDLVSTAERLRQVDTREAATQLERWMTDLAQRTDRVHVVATGLSWLGGGIRSVEQTLLALVGEAAQEILVTAYSLTPGSSRVMQRIANAASAGVRCVFVINRLAAQPRDAIRSLERLSTRYPASVTVYDFDDVSANGLHAKVLVADRRAAVIGSANLTFRGLTVSHELGLVVRGPTAASVASAFDLLTRSPQAHRAF